MKEDLTMRWVEAKDMWHMRFTGGRFIQEFYDCANIHHFFPGLKPNVDNEYTVVITNKKECSMSDSNWYVKVELTVIGPNEGAVKSGIEYQATTREMAEGIQNELGQFFIEKNKKGAQ